MKILNNRTILRDRSFVSFFKYTQSKLMHSLLVHVYEVFLSLYVCIDLKMIVHTIFLSFFLAMIERSLASLNTYNNRIVFIYTYVCMFVYSYLILFLLLFFLFAQTRVSSPFSSLCSFGGSDDDHHQ